MNRPRLLLLACVLLAACAASPPMIDGPGAASSAPPSATGQPTDVWLLPISPFPVSKARALADRLGNELHLHLRVASPVEIRMDWFGDKGQLMADRVFAALRQERQNLPDTTSKTVCIGLAVHDMNFASSRLNFEFAHHETDRLSIVSQARMMGSFFGGTDDTAETDQRLYKMVKRTIGQQFLGHSRTDDIHSVMFSPIMSLDDLDRMGTSF